MPKPRKFIRGPKFFPMEIWWKNQFPDAFRAWDEWHYRTIGPCSLQDESVIIILRNKSGLIQRLEYNIRTQEKKYEIMSDTGVAFSPKVKLGAPPKPREEKSNGNV